MDAFQAETFQCDPDVRASGLGEVERQVRQAQQAGFLFLEVRDVHRVDREETCAAGVGDVEVDAADRPAVERQGAAFRERGRLALAKEAGDPGGSLRRGVHEFDRVDLAGALVFRAFGRGDGDVREFHQGEVRLAIEHAEAVELEPRGFYDRRGGRGRGRRLHFGAQGLQGGARAVIGDAVAVKVHVA